MAKKSKDKKKKKGMSFQAIVWVVTILSLMIAFLPTTCLLFVGMLPTIVVFIIDTEPGKNKTFTVGAVNFTGCFPYLMDLWYYYNTVDAAIGHLTTPISIIVMYGSAAIGYFLNWMITVMVSSILVRRSFMRLKKIEEEKQILRDRWGEKVNGKYDLDEYGFPVTEGDSES